MKFHLFLLPLLATVPVVASAQPQPKTAPSTEAHTSMDAASKALLDKATPSYKGAHGLRASIATGANGKDRGTNTLSFSDPNLLSVAQKTGPVSVQLLLDGHDFYLVQGTSYRKMTAPPTSTVQLLGAFGGTSGQFFSAMIQGKNPIETMQTMFSKPPFGNLRSDTTSLGERMVDGEMLSGIQSNLSFQLPTPGQSTPVREQLTAWFGGSPLMLRRTQTITMLKGKTNTVTEKIVDQQLNPVFAPATFKFDPTGLKLASAQDDQSEFDPRLKVGAEPLPFETKSLDGQTISPANFKGKVLLMDFWATWCGPCVASLPELQGAYNKYQAQGLEVVGISLDEDKSALTSFTKTKKMPWPQVFDGKGWGAEVPGIYGVKAIPFMLIIGKDGKIAAVNPRDNIDAAVKAALAAK